MEWIIFHGKLYEYPNIPEIVAKQNFSNITFQIMIWS